MTSKIEGYLRIPVWLDDDRLKPLVNDDGRIPVVLESSGITLDVNLESSDIALNVNLETSDITLDVNLESSDITLSVAEQSPLTSIQGQSYGWDSANWRKLALLWGYSEVWRERKQNLNCSAGSNTLTHAVVSPGEVWVLENISVWNSNTGCTYIRIYISSGGTSYLFKQFTGPTADVPESYSGRFTLKAGDIISVLFTTCALNDDIYSDVVGYKMKVTE